MRGGLAALQPDRRILRIPARPLWRRSNGTAAAAEEREVMIATVLVALEAAPIIVASKA